MKKNHDHGNENTTNKHAISQAKDTSNHIQNLNWKENAANVHNERVQSTMKDLQQKINDAKNSENKGEVIQNAVFEMLQNMGMNIPADVKEKIKNTRGKK